MGYARGGSSPPLGTIDLSGTLRNPPEKTRQPFRTQGFLQTLPFFALHCKNTRQGAPETFNTSLRGQARGVDNAGIESCCWCFLESS